MELKDPSLGITTEPPPLVLLLINPQSISAFMLSDAKRHSHYCNEQCNYSQPKKKEIFPLTIKKPTHKCALPVPIQILPIKSTETSVLFWIQSNHSDSTT